MHKVRVGLGKVGYTVHIGPGLLAETGRLLKAAGYTHKAVIITDPTIKDLYGTSLKQSLTALGYKTAVLEIPEGEAYKSLGTAGRLYDQLAAFHAERNTPLLALGGGVIGDVAGFVAATYMRGVPLIQLPTTLLAQVDSSVGGKVAVDHGQLKNMVGAFYQPHLVISDISALNTLPEEQLANGLGEVIKYGIIKDEAFFTFLEQNIDRIRAFEEKAMEHIVTRSVQIKAEVVEKDERDTGLRNILNFGHTVGHAIETVSGFNISHGQAVGLGMLAACRIASALALLEDSCLDRIGRLLKKAGLKTKLPKVDIKAVIEATTHDKKVSGGKIKFILPRAIGDVFVTDDVSLTLVEKILAGMK